MNMTLYPKYLEEITGVRSVRVGKRYVWITTSTGQVVKALRRIVLTPEFPSAFDLAQIVAEWNVDNAARAARRKVAS